MIWSGLQGNLNVTWYHIIKHKRLKIEEKKVYYYLSGSFLVISKQQHNGIAKGQLWIQESNGILKDTDSQKIKRTSLC